MLRFIHLQDPLPPAFWHISIHPMLRFIKKVQKERNLQRNFNTSHVTVYQRRITKTPAKYSISIHPMLRFISNYKSISSFHLPISIHPMLRFIVLLERQTGITTEYFNTSHVTVYLLTQTRTRKAKSISIHPMLRFIIVHKQETQPLIAISIHPMLRFIKLVLSVTL